MFSFIHFYYFQAIHGLGNLQDVTDAVEAKSKVLDYNSLQELVKFGLSIQRNVNRLDDHRNELAVQSSKIATLETHFENVGKGTISFHKHVS